jgi:hypothetical protein
MKNYPHEGDVMEILARSVKDQTLQEGILFAGQIFRPGFYHTQYEGRTVPTAQFDERPHVRRNLLVSSKLCVEVTTGEELVGKFLVIAPNPDPDPVKYTKPIVKRGGKRDGQSNRNL